MPLVNQILGLTLLVIGLIGADLALQRRNPLKGPMRQARTLALMAAAGGFIGAPAWWQNLPFAFAWALPPLAARYLACAALAFALVSLRAAILATPGHLRLVAAMLAVYLGPLAAAALALHLDRFDFAAPVTYGFFSIVAGMLIAAFLTLLRLPDQPRGLTGGLLGLVGLVTLIWGLALFLWPAGPLPLFWPWAADPLSSRLIAAMFLTVACACLMAEGPAERRTANLLCLTYGAAVAITSILALVQGKPASPANLALWTLIALAGAWGLVTAAAPVPAPTPSPPD